MKKSCVFIAFGGSWKNNSSVPSQFKMLADTLAKKGIKVVLLVQGAIDYEDNTYPHIYSWPSKRPTRIKDALFLIKLIKKYRPKCLITQFAATNIMILIGWITGVPYRVAWYHTLSYQVELDSNKTILWLKLLRFRKKFVYKFATSIIPVSEAAKADFEKTFKIFNKCKVFYNGLKDSCEQTAYISHKDNKLVCVARLDYSKGQDVLIKAFKKAKVELPDLKLILVGNGKQRRLYSDLVSNMNLTESVSFLGRVSPDEVMDQFKTSKLSILPSRMDNCPLAIIESLSVGTPVIASRVGGIPEIIIDGETGFLFKSEDVEMLSSKMIRFLKDPDLQKRMSKAARADFLDRFEINKIIESQIQWLEEIGAI